MKLQSVKRVENQEIETLLQQHLDRLDCENPLYVPCKECSDLGIVQHENGTREVCSCHY